MERNNHLRAFLSRSEVAPRNSKHEGSRRLFDGRAPLVTRLGSQSKISLSLLCHIGDQGLDGLAKGSVSTPRLLLRPPDKMRNGVRIALGAFFGSRLRGVHSRSPV